MGSPRRWTLPSAGFAVQAVLGLAWWVWIVSDVRAAAWFSFPADAEPTVYRFALPDVALFVVGSAAVALLAARGSRWAAPAAWCVSGAVAYATLWCLGGWLWHDMRWFASAGMLLALVLDVVLAIRLGGERG